MHLALLTRGHIEWVNRFINELSTRYLEFDYKGEKKLLQMRVCPIQLWDISFPKQHLAPVLNTCLSGFQGEPMMKSHQKYIWALRKAMKFKKIPEYDKSKTLAMKMPQHIETIGIGIKEDKMLKDENGIEYEGI